MNARLKLDTNPFNRPRPDGVKAHRPDIVVSCDSCGVQLYKARSLAWRSTPKTHLTMARQAMAAHRAKTGCAGHELDTARIDAAQAIRIMRERGGKELEDAAEALGIAPAQAAHMAADALGLLGRRPAAAGNALAARQPASSKAGFEQLADRKPAALGPGVEPGEFTAPSLAGDIMAMSRAVHAHTGGVGPVPMSETQRDRLVEAGVPGQSAFDADCTCESNPEGSCPSHDEQHR